MLALLPVIIPFLLPGTVAHLGSKLLTKNDLFDKVFDQRWSDAQTLGAVVIRGFKCDDGQVTHGGPNEKAGLNEFVDFDHGKIYPQLVSGGLWVRAIDKVGRCLTLYSFRREKFSTTLLLDNIAGSSSEGPLHDSCQRH